MSKHLNELCSLLIEDLYGGLASHVFSILLTHGRLSLPALIARAHIHHRWFKHGLAVLLQQNLVSYFSPEDEDTTYYEANVRHAYNLVRIGKNAKIVEDRIGKEAGQMLSRLQMLGYGRVDEIRDLEVSSSAGSDLNEDTMLVNGTAKAAKSKRKEAENTMRQVLTARFAAQVRDMDFYPQSDLNEKAERIVIKEEFHGEAKGTKAQKLLRSRVIVKKRAWADDDAVKYPTTQNSRSHSSSRAPDSRKRRKLNGGSRRLEDSSEEEENPDDEEEEEEEEDETASPLDAVLIRLNHDKLEVSLRSHLFGNFCARRLGDTTAIVYLALLRLLERNIPRCHDEYVDEEADNDDEDGDDTSVLNTLPTATTLDIVDSLDPSIALGMPSLADKKSSKLKREASEEPTSNGAQENGTSNRVLDRQARILLVQQHMQLIEDDPANMVLKISNQGQGEWKVNFPALARDLIQIELENLFAARFGPLANRIIRILHARGKLDEKQVGTVGLIRQKDLRAKLTAMQEAGFVDTQEVPRDNSRQPSRTIYLWFFDQDRCRELLLNDTYKIMSRLLQRVKVEKEKVHSVIEKSERTDVRGHEDEYLSKAEKEALAEFREKEERLLAQVGRLDDLVALMRDFLPLKLS